MNQDFFGLDYLHKKRMEQKKMEHRLLQPTFRSIPTRKKTTTRRVMIQPRQQHPLNNPFALAFGFSQQATQPTTNQQLQQQLQRLKLERKIHQEQLRKTKMNIPSHSKNSGTGLLTQMEKIRDKLKGSKRATYNFEARLQQAKTGYKTIKAKTIQFIKEKNIHEKIRKATKKGLYEY